MRSGAEAKQQSQTTPSLLPARPHRPLSYSTSLLSVALLTATPNDAEDRGPDRGPLPQARLHVSPPFLRLDYKSVSADFTSATLSSDSEGCFNVSFLIHGLYCSKMVVIYISCLCFYLAETSPFKTVLSWTYDWLVLPVPYLFCALCFVSLFMRRVQDIHD